MRAIPKPAYRNNVPGTMSPATWPSEILNHRVSQAIELVWHDGMRSRLSYQHLRASCRCAECQSVRRKGAPSALARPGLDLVDVTPISDTGLQFHFSDGHERGIFPWAYLRALSEAPSSS